MTTRQRQRPEAPTRLNRIISIQRATQARDRYGSEILTYGELAEVWAEKRRGNRPSSERFLNDSNKEQALRRAVWRIRFRDDVYEIDRILDDAGLIWDIEGIIDLPGRRYRDLICAADVSALSPLG